MSSVGLSHRWALRLLAGALLAGSGTAAADGGKDRPRFVETWRFDPQTGRWVEQAPPQPGTEDGDLDLARQSLARQDYKDALERVEAWIKAYGGSAPRYPEALYLKGTAALELADYRKAHDTYKSLLTDFPGSPYADRALSGEFRISEQYLAGQKRKAWRGLLRVRDYEEGIKILDDIVANHPDSELAEYALKTKADYYYQKGEFQLAEEEYARLGREFPNGRYEPYALLRSAQAALAAYPGPKFDDAGLVEAEERFRQYQQRYPQLAEAQRVPVLLDQIRAARGQKEYEIARFYERTRKRDAAAFYYRSTVENWPGTTWAAQAEARLALLGLGTWTPPASQPAAGVRAAPWTAEGVLARAVPGE